MQSGKKLCNFVKDFVFVVFVKDFIVETEQLSKSIGNCQLTLQHCRKYVY